MDDKKIIKKRAMMSGIGFIVFSVVLLFIIYISNGNKIPLGAIAAIGIFDLIVISSLMIGVKYGDKIKKPKSQYILGRIMIGLSCLQFAMYFIAILFDKKLLISDFVNSMASALPFLIVGIVIVKKSKKQLSENSPIKLSQN